MYLPAECGGIDRISARTVKLYERTKWSSTMKLDDRNLTVKKLFLCFSFYLNDYGCLGKIFFFQYFEFLWLLLHNCNISVLAAATPSKCGCNTVWLRRNPVIFNHSANAARCGCGLGRIRNIAAAISVADRILKPWSCQYLHARDEIKTSFIRCCCFNNGVVHMFLLICSLR